MCSARHVNPVAVVARGLSLTFWSVIWSEQIKSDLIQLPVKWVGHYMRPGYKLLARWYIPDMLILRHVILPHALGFIRREMVSGGWCLYLRAVELFSHWSACICDESTRTCWLSEWFRQEYQFTMLDMVALFSISVTCFFFNMCTIKYFLFILCYLKKIIAF